MYKIFLFLGCTALFHSPALFACSSIEIENETIAKEPCLHVLIATIGRSTLLCMLNSLDGQLNSSDYLTVIFDAKDEDAIYEEVCDKLTTLPCKCTIFMEPVNLGYWGHGIRNKYNVLLGDFIMHADDDDIYLPHAFLIIRKAIKEDFNALYIFNIVNGRRVISGKPIKYRNISTQNGVIPSAYNSQASWGTYYGGDFTFYNTLQKKVPTIHFIKHVIYSMRP